MKEKRDRDTRKERGTEVRREKEKRQTESKTPAVVIFVDRTEGGKLASELKEKEKEVNKVGKKKVKVVERNGEQLSAILTSSNPWGEEKCSRQDCLSCKTEKGKMGKCRERNLVYETRCKLCKARGETVTYVGETSRSLYERQKEHLQDCIGQNSKSHMREHTRETHRRELETVDEIAEVFEIRILERYQTSIQRQIGEAVHIRGAKGTTLNDKDEFNRCELPKLSVSKQRQKMIVNTRDREIGEEADMFQEQRRETQYKRREGPGEETNVRGMNRDKEARDKKRAKRQRRGDDQQPNTETERQEREVRIDSKPETEGQLRQNMTERGDEDKERVEKQEQQQRPERQTDKPPDRTEDRKRDRCSREQE